MKIRLDKAVVVRLLAVALLLFCGTELNAQQAQTPPDPPPGFDKAEKMIAMRDGVPLFTVIYTPKEANASVPIIYVRTPYSVSGMGARYIPRPFKPLADDGYIFVFQDVRGRFKSEGQFVMQRPPRPRNEPKAIDEGTDAYDTIEWLVKNVPRNNGRVGMTGGSYDAWLAVMATIEPHPALKAVCEQATPADMFLGDDFHHNGAFRLSYGFEYAFELESTKDENANFKFDRYDTYEWYLKMGALSNADAKYFHGKLPTWNDFVNHPNYDDYWKQRALAYQLKGVTVPIMHVAGWWDQEDFYGPMKAYEILEKTDTTGMNYLVVGPWNHGGWGGEGSKLGKIDFESPTGKHFREEVLPPWFAHYLKGKGKPDQPEALAFETGSNKWQSYEAWPPRRSVARRGLYLHADGKLSFDPPPTEGNNQFDSYVSDPGHPVPYRHRPIEATYFPAGSNWYTWLVEDQRFAHKRADVLSWETETLTEDVTISGDIMARLFASTTGSDSDFIVKLIDVYPEDYQKDIKMSGYQLMIASEILRGRFRNSFEKPEPITPNKVTEFLIGLGSNSHVFLKGHKIMVQVQSTWFPVYDRNPQKFVPNIFKAKESDYQTATQRIFRSKRFASRIEVPVLNR
ncbi:MAG: CocE/NonD family hydrolase [Pyrinomonadaceae bacterium]